MTILVAFLRAINVGGRSVTKEKLTQAFLSLGFRDVSTYKQSGNVIFETGGAPETIRKMLQEKLPKLLGIDTVVFVRTIAQLMQIIEMREFDRHLEKKDRKEKSSFLVTFLESPPANFPLKLPVIIPRSTAEVISFDGKEIFSVTHGHGDGGKPNPYLESKLKMQATTRNMNVIREIVKKFCGNRN